MRLSLPCLFKKQAAAGQADPPEIGPLREGDLYLTLERRMEGDPERGWYPCYRFSMLHAANGALMGRIDLRVGDSPVIERYSGHIGYHVYPAYRGKRRAERAARLLLPLARKLGFEALWITCNPDNTASRITCERLGAVYVETVDLPPGNDMYNRGERRKMRYRLDL